MHQTNPFSHPILSNPTSSPRSQQPTHAAHHRRESPNRLTILQEENERKQRLARENSMMEIQTAIMLDDVKRKSARDNDFLVARIRTLEAESQARIEIMREESERRKEREDQIFETKLGYLNVESKLRRKAMMEENERSVRLRESKSAEETKASVVEEAVEGSKDADKPQQGRLDEFFEAFIKEPMKNSDDEEY